MRLLFVDIKHFMSFGDVGRIDLNNRGLVLIAGDNRDDSTATSNGAGKSAFANALLWSLYGITQQGLEGDDVCNRYTKDPCEVCVQFDVDGQEYLVKRTRRGSKPASLMLHAISPAYVDISAATISATQEKINKLLGMNAQTFTHCVLFGQSQSYRFSMLTDKEQKAILDEILGTSVYKLACEAARERSRELVISIAQWQAKQASLRDSVVTLGNAIRDITTDYEKERRRRVREARNKWRKLKQEHLALQEKLPKKRDAIAGKLEEAEQARVEYKLKLDGIASKLADLRLKHETARTEAKRLDNHRLILHGSKGACLTCGQKLTPAQRAKHADQLAKEIHAIQHADADVAEEIRALMDEEVRCAGIHTQWGMKLDRFRSEKAAVTLDEHLMENTKLARADAFAALKAVKAEELDPSRLKEMVEKLSKNKVDIDVLTEKIEKAEHQCKLDDFWVDGFGASGLRSLLLDQALPLLNEKVNEYAAVLTDGNITIEFDTQSTLKSGKSVEKFTVKAINEHGADQYRANSSGERAKIDLCVGLALQSLALAHASVNVAFFDEPVESLDAVALDRVATLLTTALHDRESVFVITHREELKSYFTDVITIVKESDISRLES